MPASMIMAETGAAWRVAGRSKDMAAAGPDGADTHEGADTQPHETVEKIGRLRATEKPVMSWPIVSILQTKNPPQPLSRRTAKTQ